MPFPRVNVIALLEFKLTYHDVVVQHISPFAIGTVSANILWKGVNKPIFLPLPAIGKTGFFSLDSATGLKE